MPEDAERLHGEGRSVFWPCGVIQPVPGLFVGPTGNSVALGDSNTLGRA
jgi:hypothetical protein